MITPIEYNYQLEQIENLDDFNRPEFIAKEPVFDVDLNTREIKIPTQFRNLAVYSDHKAETIWFVVNRYFDGVDLYHKRVAMQYVNALGEEGLDILDTYDFNDAGDGQIDVFDSTKHQRIEKNELLIAWKLDYAVTKASGPISFSIRFFEVDNNAPSVLSYNLTTRPASVNILNGLYVTENATSPILPKTKIEDLVDQIYKAYDKGGLALYDYNQITGSTMPMIDGIRLQHNVDSSKFSIKYPNLLEKPTLNDGIFTGAMTSRNLVIQKNEKNEITDISVGIDVDTDLSLTSENPVQNKVVAANFQSAESRLKKIEDELAELTFIPMEITAFSVVPNIAEMGSTVSNAKLNWTYNIDKAPKQVLLNDVSIDNTVKEYDVNEDIKETKTFTLKTIDTGKTSEKSTVLNFVNGIYYNAASVPAEYNSDFINSLAQRALSVEKNIELKLEVADGQYAYICTPDVNGDYIFTIGGFDGGFGKFPVATVEFTNEFGHTEMYRIYKSDNTNLGSTTVKLS